MVSDETYSKDVEDLKKEIENGDFQNDMIDSDNIIDCHVSFEDLAYNISKVKK